MTHKSKRRIEGILKGAKIRRSMGVFVNHLVTDDEAWNVSQKVPRRDTSCSQQYETNQLESNALRKNRCHFYCSIKKYLARGIVLSFSMLFHSRKKFTKPPLPEGRKTPVEGSLLYH